MKVEMLSKYKHLKSGHIVTVLDLCQLQTGWPSSKLHDMQTMILYEHNGKLWVRSEEEFTDGRFELCQ